MTESSWAYDFTCDQPIRAIRDIFNQASPWQWQMRDRVVFGEYLNCRPIEGVRLQIHQYPYSGEYGVVLGLRDKGFMALLEIGARCTATRSEIDTVFRHLLQSISANEVMEIEPYD